MRRSRVRFPEAARKTAGRRPSRGYFQSPRRTCLACHRHARTLPVVDEFRRVRNGLTHVARSEDGTSSTRWPTARAPGKASGFARRASLTSCSAKSPSPSWSPMAALAPTVSSENSSTCSTVGPMQQHRMNDLPSPRQKQDGADTASTGARYAFSRAVRAMLERARDDGRAGQPTVMRSSRSWHTILRRVGPDKNVRSPLSERSVMLFLVYCRPGVRKAR